eukprot:COSAG01_NODE_47403_length_390_cov_2.116838_1_plen_54_part_10
MPGGGILAPQTRANYTLQLPHADFRQGNAPRGPVPLARPSYHHLLSPPAFIGRV